MTVLLLLFSHWISAQTADKLSIATCYELAKVNYPAIKKMDLIAKTGEYDIQNASKRYLPQISFSGQATYQSQTVSFADAVGAIPGMALPSISKDQYKIQGAINQLIYDGANTRHEQELIAANRALQKQQLETSLYALKSRINDIFFAILLMDAQLKQNELNMANLQTQLEKTAAALENGVAFRSNLDELKAEITRMEMVSTTYKADRAAYLRMLSLFIGQDLPETTQLALPAPVDRPTANNRPELVAFDLQKSVYDAQEKQLRTAYLPQVSAVFQGAYGRPTLNIIENDFGPWYIAGIRFNWSLSGLYSLSNRKNTLDLRWQSVAVDRETFLFNTRLDVTLQDEQVKKYTELLQQDDEAIALRTSVRESAEAQLDNGVITTHEYIQKVNAEHLAQQSKILHELQLLQAKYNQQFITGN